MPSKEPTYVDRLNSLTAAFRNAVTDVIRSEQIACLKGGSKEAADALERVRVELLKRFPSVEEAK